MVDKLLSNPDDLPEAIACANNCMAIGVANALEKEGIRVPEDIAVVGYDYSSEGALNRLADVEKYTFVNVMSYIKENKSLFEEKKYL